MKKKRGAMENPLWGNGIFKKKKKEDDIFAILKQVPIFSDLTPKELTEVEKIVHHRTYKKNEAIIQAGDPGLGMYIIAKGSVEIVEENEKAGKRTLAKLSAGSFFGDMALLDEEPRSASAIALEDSALMGFFRPDFLDLIYRKPKLGIKILLSLARVINERLRHTNELLAKIQEKKD
jgi:CRP/FNR family cyclic AMP-dependent transcriptional regulator